MHTKICTAGEYCVHSVDSYYGFSALDRLLFAQLYEIHSWAQRKLSPLSPLSLLSPLNILLSINGPLISF